MNLALPDFLTPASWPPPWLMPWHAALALAALFFLGYVIARLQFLRARDDWADAFFYSPSSKTKQRRRRQKWQDRMWALLIAGMAAVIAALVFYLRR
ncbi:MAG TPA: hypothetical protein VNM48_21835 [Chloroflexota bacterium]|nr:hypothetical protein [Chloroflexota bacterium]